MGRVVSTPCFVRDECESIAKKIEEKRKKKYCTVVLSTRPFFKKQCKIEIHGLASRGVVFWPGSLTATLKCAFIATSVRGGRVGLSVGLWIMRSWCCPVIGAF